MMNLKVLPSVVILLSFLNAGLAQAEEIHMWIATSARNDVFSKIQEPFEKATGIKIIPAGNTAGTKATMYFKDVLAGKVEAATSSISYEDWADLMRNEEHVPESELKPITHRVIGHDLMSIVANKSAGVHRLEVSQVGALFSGKVTNWKSVGGADKPVTLVIVKTKPTTNTAFRHITMGGAEFKGKIIEVTTWDELPAKVASTPGAVGFGPSGLKLGDALAVQTPPIGRPCILITKGRPSPAVEKLVEFILKEGRKYGVK